MLVVFLSRDCISNVESSLIKEECIKQKKNLYVFHKMYIKSCVIP